jgi:hypothetical protein
MFYENCRKTDCVINAGTRGSPRPTGMENERPTEVANLEPEANTVFGTNSPWS